jgi:hypothetical protein
VNTIVIAGLDPAIHLFCQDSFAKKMDARVEPAHDDPELPFTLNIALLCAIVPSKDAYRP